MLRPIIFLLCALICAGQDDAGLASLYKEAVTAERNADYPTATRLYEKILAVRPDLAEAHANLGNLHYVQGHYEEARLSFERAVKLKPQLAGPHFFLGVLAFRTNELAKAETYLKKAVALDPANPLIQLHLGYVSYARGHFETAIGYFDTVVSGDPKNEDAWYHLSKASSQASKIYFDELQRKHPESYYTKLARAHFFEAQANWAEALQEYGKAAQLQPSEPLKAKIAYVEARVSGKEAPFVLTSEEIDGSTVFLHQTPAVSELPALFQKWKPAKTGKTEALNPQKLYRTAEAYQLLSYLSSLSVYAYSPDSYRAHQLKGQSFEAAGRTEDAIVEYRQALERNPQLRSVHFAIGNLYWRNSSFEEALPELMAELRVSPNDPDTHYEVGDILFARGKLEEAAKHYVAALESAPNMVEAHLALERIYTSTGSPEKAIHHLGQAARIAPADPTPHYRLWLLYRKQGKTADAERERQIFQKLKAQAPVGSAVEAVK